MSGAGQRQSDHRGGARTVSRGLGPLAATALFVAMTPLGADAKRTSVLLALDQSAGFTDNLLLDAASAPEVEPRMAGLYRLEPLVLASWALPANLGLSVRYDGQLSVYASPGESTELENWHLGTVDLSWRRGDWRLATRAAVSGYDFSAFAGAAHVRPAWSVGAAVELGVLSLLARSELAGRVYTGGEGVAGRADLEWSVVPGVVLNTDFGLTAGVGYELVYRDSEEPVADTPIHGASAQLGYSRGRLAANARYVAQVRDDLAGGRDVFHSLAIRVDVGVLGWLAVTTAYRLRAERAGDSVSSFTSHELTAGLEISLRSAAPLAAPRNPHDPVRVGRRITFRTHQPGAETVSVVGSFNDWNPSAHRMRGPDAEGWFELAIELRTGRHEYQYAVDGRRVDPSAVTNTAPDGFGGKNAVLEVD